MEKITLANDFHRTKVTLHVRDNRLTAGQAKRALRELCGRADCYCGNLLGMQGPQPHKAEVIPERDRHGVITARINQ